jgi:hypothetical protein
MTLIDPSKFSNVISSGLLECFGKVLGESPDSTLKV